MRQQSHSLSTLLVVDNLYAKAEEVSIVNGLSLEINKGEIHALMGPNGSGKSTLAHCIAGHPAYSITSGDIRFAGESLIEMSPEDRAAMGIFLVFQYPAAIPGVPIHQFLRTSLNSLRATRGEEPLTMASFKKLLKGACEKIELPWSFIERSVNDGFSGGEKKRLEALQMLILQPKLIIMDEIDSGLDVDALKVIANATNWLCEQFPETSVLIITHYQRILSHIIPNFVHIVSSGKIIETGDASLALLIDQKGYKR